MMRKATTHVLAATIAITWIACGAANGQQDIADISSEDLRANDDPNKRYFLIGPKQDAKAPASGYRLLIVMPGGDGSAEFNPFVKRIFGQALGPKYLVAQLVAVKWTPDQRIVWPTRKLRVDGMKFSTEEFIEAVIADASRWQKIDRRRITLLAWSSSGPATYAISLNRKSRVRGVFIAMSVFRPQYLPPLTAAKGRPYYLYHSPDDGTCPFRMAKAAEDQLSKAGARVTLATYDGGHGWKGDVFANIRAGLRWLEENAGKHCG